MTVLARYERNTFTSMYCGRPIHPMTYWWVRDVILSKTSLRVPFSIYADKNDIRPSARSGIESYPNMTNFNANMSNFNTYT